MSGALSAASMPVVVVNPRQVRDFAKAAGRLAMTDALDAQVIAHFAEAVRPRIRAHIEWLEQELEDLDRELRDMLRRSRCGGSKRIRCALSSGWGRSSLLSLPKGALLASQAELGALGRG